MISSLLGALALTQLGLVPSAPLAAQERSQISVDVTEASYVVRFVDGDNWMIAPRGEKYLVVDLDVKNTGRSPFQYSGQSVVLSVLDSDTNSEVNSQVVRSGMSYVEEIAPGEAKKDKVVMSVPSDLRSPTLEAKTLTGSNKIRLGPKMRKVTGAYLYDGGATARDEILANRSQVVPVGSWDVQLVSTIETRQSPHAFLAATPSERFVIMTLKFTNALASRQTLDETSMRLNVIDVDGKFHPWNRYILTNQDEDNVRIELKPKGQTTVRLPFVLLNSTKAKSLRLTDPASGRVAIIELTRE